ncbi:MAG: cyclase [Sphingobacteriales bacterium]|jgi:cyclase
MLARRIIPCLDIKNGRTVKGTNFVNLIDAGDPVELATQYDKEGADELVFLDISATDERRKTLIPLVEKIAEALTIPFTVGGGISSVEDVDKLLKSGADKVSINSAALSRPELINEISQRFGSQCMVIAIDAKLEENGEWEVYSHGGKTSTGRTLFEWAKEAEERGAGEILFTSISNDGSKSGFAVDALKQISANCRIPVIASGGAGKFEHFKDVLETGVADAALAASVFHYKIFTIPALKTYLATENIPVRLPKIESSMKGLDKLDFDKMDGLIPAVIQDSSSLKVLMVGFMNEEAVAETQKRGKVVFYSRTKKRLWEKGETSGNHLKVKDISVDCDNDTLLIQVVPNGPACHTGSFSCFSDQKEQERITLYELETVINNRWNDNPDDSYTAYLRKRGIKKIAQKVGEEATEAVIEAVDGKKKKLSEETADLLFHVLVMLKASGTNFRAVMDVLAGRHKKGAKEKKDK